MIYLFLYYIIIYADVLALGNIYIDELDVPNNIYIIVINEYPDTSSGNYEDESSDPKKLTYTEFGKIQEYINKAGD